VGQSTLGSLIESTGDLKRARELFEGSLKTYKALVKADPKDTGATLGLASAHARVAHLASRDGDKKAAREHLKAAKKVLDELERGGQVKDNPGFDNLKAYVKTLGD
jgi:hypothetical protein